MFEKQNSNKEENLAFFVGGFIHHPPNEGMPTITLLSKQFGIRGFNGVVNPLGVPGNNTKPYGILIPKVIHVNGTEPWFLEKEDHCCIHSKNLQIILGNNRVSKDEWYLGARISEKQFEFIVQTCNESYKNNPHPWAGELYLVSLKRN